MLTIYISEQPEVVIKQQCTALMATAATHRCFAIAFEHIADYLVPPQRQPLIALLALCRTLAGIQIYAAVQVDDQSFRAALNTLPEQPSVLAEFAYDQGLPWLQLDAPLQLQPIYIPKPWGQEIWYTGIEARGQSAITAQGLLTPLPWVLNLMPSVLAAGQPKQLLLLKILDPLADEIYGDLYFEMHEQKQEVYIVTAIDKTAWPSGTGAIRLGFSRQKRAHYQNEQEFKHAYLAAVEDYREVRKQIDALLDQQRLAHQIDLLSPVDAITLAAWQAELPKALRLAEANKRQVMDDFTELYPLVVGDVVKVSCRVPHALQHGVRTLEFQTPVYERKILSFAQKVLTQAEWDTQAALAQVVIDTPMQPEIKCLVTTAQMRIEQVVEFDDFEVQRIQLEAGQVFICGPNKNYSLLLLLLGDLHIYYQDTLQKLSHNHTEEPAFLLPATDHEYRLLAPKQAVTLLLAKPRAL